MANVQPRKLLVSVWWPNLDVMHDRFGYLNSSITTKMNYKLLKKIIKKALL